MTLNEQTKTATIKVSGLAAKTHLQLVYATARGQVLGEALVNADGTQQFEVDQLVGFEQNLKVVVKENETKTTLKELKFKEAYIVKYQEDFDATGNQPLKETFTLSAKEIELGTGKHVNEWV